MDRLILLIYIRVAMILVIQQNFFLSFSHDVFCIIKYNNECNIARDNNVAISVNFQSLFFFFFFFFFFV